MPQYYLENNNVQDKRPENGDDDGETLTGLDLDALRSFMTGMECGSFARAALRLSRSTSASSKKLESQCGAALVTKQGGIWCSPRKAKS